MTSSMNMFPLIVSHTMHAFHYSTQTNHDDDNTVQQPVKMSDW